MPEQPKPRFDVGASVDAAHRRILGVEILRTMPVANVAEAYQRLEAALADVVGRSPSLAETVGIRRWVSHFPAAVDRVEEVCEVIRRHDGKPRRWSDLVSPIEGALYLSYPLEPWEVGAVRTAAEPMRRPDDRDLPEIAAAIVARARSRGRGAAA